MSVAEAIQLNERIQQHILHAQMKEAFSGLGALMQLNGFGKAYDKLTETENTFRYLLRYRLEGFPDPDSENVERGIRRQLLELSGEAFHRWMTRNSPTFYYDRIRIDRVNGGEDLEPLAENLKQYGERLTMVELMESSDDRLQQVVSLTRQRENTVGLMFMKLFVSELWTENDRDFLMGLYDDPAVFEHEKGLFLSALLFSLMPRFDVNKVLFLIDLLTHPEVEVSERALVVLILILYRYDARLTMYPEIAQRLTALLDERPSLQASFVRVFYQLIRSKDTDAVTKRMQEEILPEMSKMGSALQDKLRESDEIADEFNPDWQHMMENSEFSIKMQQFSDMQLEGIDVYMSTFSTQKGYSFFLDFFNWFMPFYPSHTSLRDLFGNASLDGTTVLEAVVKSDYLCSSDKFSFCFNLLQVPASYRASMSSQMGADSEAFDEIRKSNMGMNAAYRLEMTSNRYIQDLYRFFKLHHRRKDFPDPFEQPLDFHRTSVFASLLASEEPLRRIASLYFTNHHYAEALDVFDRLLTLCPTEAELHQKRGYCLYQLDRLPEALEAYKQADLIRSDSVWTLKRMATIYRLLRKPDDALIYYQRAEALAPEDIGLILNTGHVLLEAGNYSDALNRYFKAEVLTDGAPKTHRPIAWCSFMCRRYDQAARYYQKVLDNTPTVEDYLNAGHVEWCKGFPMKAVELYKRGIRVTHTILPDFLELFRADKDELLRHGITASEWAAVRDEFLYQLEE
jgi:tetratricopeptide (TPR) repeat protein